MQTAIKYDKLKDLPRDQALRELAKAVSYEFAKPVVAMEMAKHAAIAKKSGLVGPAFASNDPGPSFESAKAFLANKFNTPSDSPLLGAITNDFMQFFHTNMPEMDMAYTVLFDAVDMRTSNHDTFELTDTNAGIGWTQRKPGERTKIRKAISESQTTLKYLEFSDGIGILDAWLDYQKWWQIDEVIAEFRTNYYDTKAAKHYGLLTALGAGVNQAFATDDVQTFNNAAAALIRAARGKGLAVGDNPTFYAVCAVEYVGRLEKMLTAQRGSAIVDQGTVSQPMAHHIGGVIGTTHVAAADTGWYLVLPGRKSKSIDWKDLTIETDRDITASATNMVGVGRYNCIIGDSASQIKRCLYS